MRYTKSIILLFTFNLLLVFFMIYIANNTRDIEKDNSSLKTKISEISENIKVNKIELVVHQNSSYLKKMYKLYFFDSVNYNTPKIVKIDNLSKQDNNIKLVSSNN